MKGLEIMNANDMRLITIDGRKEYKNSVLNSDKFRKIIRGIEDEAREGFESFQTPVKPDYDCQELDIIANELTAAGYTCDLIVSTEKFLGISYRSKMFRVTW